MSYEFYDRICGGEDDKNHDLIMDYQNGTEVCVNCGKVVYDQIFSFYNNYSHSAFFNNKKYKVDKKTNLIKEDYNINVFNATELCKDVLNAYNVSTEIIELSCKKLHNLEKKLKPSNLATLAAICFEKTCIEKGVQRSKNEICHMFKISPKLLQTKKVKVEKIKNQIDPIKPSSLFSRLMLPVKIPFKIQKKLECQADAIFESVNSIPAVVNGYVIYNYFKENKIKILKKKKKTKKKVLRKASMKDVAKICLISSTSIKRLRGEIIKKEKNKESNKNKQVSK